MEIWSIVYFELVVHMELAAYIELAMEHIELAVAHIELAVAHIELAVAHIELVVHNGMAEDDGLLVAIQNIEAEQNLDIAMAVQNIRDSCNNIDRRPEMDMLDHAVAEKHCYDRICSSQQHVD